jgi:hypothetical protein
MAPLLLAILAGCGDSNLQLGKVSGKVTYKGRPVTAAKVTFFPERGPAATGLLDDQGRYELMTLKPGDGVMVGKNRVGVSPILAGVSLTPGKPPALPVQEKSIIPAKYHNPQTSEFIVEVRNGGNTFDFDLKD